MEEFQEAAEQPEASSLQEERVGPGVSMSMFIALGHENNEGDRDTAGCTRWVTTEHQRISRRTNPQWSGACLLRGRIPNDWVSYLFLALLLLRYDIVPVTVLSPGCFLAGSGTYCSTVEPSF